MRKQLINLDPVKDEVRTKLLDKYDATTYMNTDSIKIELDIKEILAQHIEAKQLEDPTIYITPNAYTKMRALVNKTETEIGWYGTVCKMPGLNNVYIIEDILVYPQTVTGATCTQDDDKMFEFEMSLTTEQVNSKRFHGHSHVNMGVTPSGVDENFYQDILTQVTDYFIVAITNKREEYTVRFYDIENNIMYSDVPIEVLLDGVEGQTIDQWYTQEKEKLSRPTVSIPEPVIKYKGTFADSYYQHEDDNVFAKNTEHLVWDDEYGYITESERDWFRQTSIKPKGKRGRPAKHKGGR